MESSRVSSMISPRRQKNMEVSFTSWKRSSSDSSSSSAILVAGPPQQSPQAIQQHQIHGDHDAFRLQSYGSSMAKRTDTYITWGKLVIRFVTPVAKESLQAILRLPPKPSSRASNASMLRHGKDEIHDDADQDESIDDRSDDDQDRDDIEEDNESRDEDHDDGDREDLDADSNDRSAGPNHRGTYSKEYVRAHPEIKWVHRGQGRYLPASEIKSDVSVQSARQRRQRNEDTNASVATSEETMEIMTKALVQYFDDFRRKTNPDARDNWSPTFKSQFNQILHLIRTTSRQQWPRMIDSIGEPGFREITRRWSRAMERQFPTKGSSQWDAGETGARLRLSRHTKPTVIVPSLEHRRSTRLTDGPNNTSYGEGDGADSSDGSQDPDKTFRRDYVDAHADEDFYHTGNGWYKRGTRPDETEKRRNSSTSQARKSFSSESSRGLDENTTIHAEDLHKFPGKIFHHKGNGWYRPGVAPMGRKGTMKISQDGKPISYKPSDHVPAKVEKDDDEVAALEPDATVDKAFTLRHPSVEWIHRGQGRYKRKSSVFGSAAGTVTPAPSSERRSSRGDIGLGRGYADTYVNEDVGSRRTSGRTMFVKRNSRSDFLEVPDQEPFELFDKDYVEAHPHETFYHRGQGRYARGLKPRPAGGDKMGNIDEGLYDSTYVQNHPTETFHHRGQGKWARGLPPSGASNKTAVRGPGAALLRTESSRTGEENEQGERPPPVSTLLRKEEGPARWPHLHWIYRGGGKWCRQTKEEAQRTSHAASASRKPRTFPPRTEDGPEAQLRRETRAAKPIVKTDGFMKVITRRRRGHNLVSKVSSNEESQAPTPRPPLLPSEEDQLADEDLPSLYKTDWSDEEEDELDDVDRFLRKRYDPMTGAHHYVKALTKYDPAVRSLANLKQLAANAQSALMQLQNEYLLLDVVAARHPMAGKKERKPVHGGRQIVEHALWEDRKEAMLYDYSLDPRKIGYQDPDAQRIVRDAEGRELRRRRGRIDPHHTAVDYGDGAMTGRRTVKPVSRFDGVVIPPPRKRSRLTLNDDNAIDETNAIAANGDDTPSMTPERTHTPSLHLVSAEDYRAPTHGRWKDHVPKRIRELRGESVASSRSGDNNNSSSRTGSISPKGAGIRKGRPPGSKNRAMRKDAGIKKGPRKPKVPSKEDEMLLERLRAEPGVVEAAMRGYGPLYKAEMAMMEGDEEDISGEEDDEDDEGEGDM